MGHLKTDTMLSRSYYLTKERMSTRKMRVSGPHYTWRQRLESSWLYRYFSIVEPRWEFRMIWALPHCTWRPKKDIWKSRNGYSATEPRWMHERRMARLHYTFQHITDISELRTSYSSMVRTLMVRMKKGKHLST